jgi:hypothetical protein
MANFNVPPYFDDYDENKGYYKILFRPSVSVQARELNQMQTMLQKQIERFGAHIFREGSIVLGGAFDLELDVSYVRATSVFPTAGDLQSFVGKTVIGNTSGIRAYIKSATYDEDNNIFVFLLRYLSSSINTSVFLDNETVSAEDNAALNFVISSVDTTGLGSIFSISQGVIFSKGYFVAFPTQTIIVDKYSQTPSATIGLNVVENFITELYDPTLVSNALGSTNENAPGADRYHIDATLSVKPYKEGYDNENFVPLLDINNGVVETTQERSQYARIYDELAKRTYDESGDYYVKGFDIRTREHLDTGENEGLYFSNNGGDSTKLSVDVEPGVAYVKGYEINKLVTEHIITDKSTTYNTVNNQLINARTGGYFFIQQIVGSPAHDKAILVDLYDTAENRISSNIKSTQAPSGKKIGTAYLKALVYESGTLGMPEGRMKAHLYDFTMNPGYIVSDARALSITSSPNYFFADIVLSNGTAIFYDNNINVLLFPVGADHIRTIRSNTGSVDTSFQFNRSTDGTISFSTGGGVLSIAVSTSGEGLSYGEGTLSSAEKRELIISLSGDKDIRLPGTVAASNASSNTIVGNGTDFTKLRTGDRILINGGNEYYIAKINSATNLEFSNSVGGTFSNTQFSKALRVGDIIDMTSNGSSGTIRNANITSGSLFVDLEEDTTYVSGVGNTVNAKITYRVERTTAGEVKKILKPNVLVKIQTSNNSAGTSGPYNLGIPDVHRIRSIIANNSTFSITGIDVTSSFVLENGQRDNHYDHARIRNIGGIDLENQYLLVELDHFEPDYSTGFGYFSVDSYPVNDNVSANTTIFTYEIPTYISSTGTEFNLRNVLDFRPVKAKTANSTTNINSATTNPGITTEFNADVDGLRMVAPDSDISADYSFYLARRDIVTLDKEGNYGLIKGTPSSSPISPNVPDSVMGIANIYIPPYPSISETLARILNNIKIGCISKKIANIRYTMREIGVIKNRVENLEYYNALTLLEKNALDLKIIGADGLDRFKNGFFVDGFLDHSLGDTSNIDYKIAIDKTEQTIRPFFELDSFQYRLEPSVSSGYQQTGNLITRPYTETVLLENKNVTTTRNIEQSVFRFVGTLELTPDGDTWCDTETVDKTVSFGDDLPLDLTFSTEWGSWQTYSVGYNVYLRNSGDRSGTINPSKYAGTYTSYAAAVAASQKASRTVIESVVSEQRTGTVTKIASETQFEELGNFVTDVGVKPYIRPQVIRVFGRGLKANTRYYTYFDGENMSGYVVSGVIPENGDIEQVTDYLPEGGELRSNEYGEIIAFLRLPDTEKRFRTGTKEIIITDSPTNAIDATSYAKSYFTAVGLSVQKQNTIISTKVPYVQTETISENRTKQSVEIFGPSCMAYSFPISVPPSEDGIFLSSVDVWVSDKHPTLGMWVEIRETNSAGGVTRTQVPYSEVWLESDEVNLWDGSSETEELNKTRIVFPSPIFLMNDNQYVFTIHTEGLNPDYYFWVSRLGETDIISGTQVTSRQLTGTLYTTNNNLNYDIVPDVDLKVRFNRANFATGTGTVVLGNKPTEFLNINNIEGSFSRNGETISTSEALTLSTTSNTSFGNIAVGDVIISVNNSGNSVSGNVISIVGDIYYTDAIGYSNAQSYSVANSTGGSLEIDGTLLSVLSGSGTLRSYDSNKNFMIIDNSNGRFYSNAVIKGHISGNTARIESFDQFKYSTTTLKPYYLVFKNSSCNFEKAGWLSDESIGSFDTYTGTSEWFPGVVDDYSSFNNEVTVLSRIDEITQFGQSGPNSSARVRAILTTDSPYVSPVIDLSRAQSIFVHNIINNDDTGETNPSGGNLLSRYISKPVTLADGQDAEDLKVYITGYRPPNSDVKLWVKLRHNEDGVLFTENPWVEMVNANSAYSSAGNRFDFKEFEYNIPENMKNGNGVIQYIKNAINITANTTGIVAAANSILIENANTIFSANDEVFYSVPYSGTPITPLSANTYYYVKTVNSTAITLSETAGGSEINISDFRTDPVAEIHTIGGDVYTGYKQFSLKVGLKGTNSANPPRAGDLRGVALQL